MSFIYIFVSFAARLDTVDLFSIITISQTNMFACIYFLTKAALHSAIDYKFVIVCIGCSLRQKTGMDFWKHLRRNIPLLFLEVRTLD